METTTMLGCIAVLVGVALLAGWHSPRVLEASAAWLLARRDAIRAHRTAYKVYLKRFEGER